MKIPKGRNALSNATPAQLDFWQGEIDRQIEVTKKRIFIIDNELPPEPDIKSFIPELPNKGELTAVEQVMVENIFVNEFMLRDVLGPILQQFREDVQSFRKLPTEDRVKETQMVNPYRYGVRTLPELIDAVQRVSASRLELAGLLPDLNKTSDFHQNLSDYAKEVASGKVNVYHRRALPETIYNKVTPGISAEESTARRNLSTERMLTRKNNQQLIV